MGWTTRKVATPIVLVSVGVREEVTLEGWEVLEVLSSLNGVEVVGECAEADLGGTVEVSVK